MNYNTCVFVRKCMACHHMSTFFGEAGLDGSRLASPTG